MTETELRYGFGQNWSDFVDNNLSDAIVEESVRHMKAVLRRDSLTGLTFLDIGCGSGIHSLAALRMGAARVLSFDYDVNSVATTRRVREWAGASPDWDVMQGSVLDEAFMRALPQADIVYSWGVLHHTGDMWTAIRNAAIPLKPGGDFYIALYSSDMYVKPTPDYWVRLKRRYNRASARGKHVMEYLYALRFHVLPELKAGRNPFPQIASYGGRGMTYWTDVRDWLGGYPMEFAGLRETVDFAAAQLGLSMVNVVTGEGCTEYVFADTAQSPRWAEIEAARARTPLEGPFANLGGRAWIAPLPHLIDQADAADGNHKRSRIMLYEDGVALGLAHTLHDHIKRYGGGRFSHWGDSLYFSASDSSDPNGNGRAYSYCLTY